MKTILGYTAALAAAFSMISCEEEKQPAYVKGYFECSQCETISFDGNLDRSGAKLYGYCEEKKDGSFSFEVGSDDRDHVTSATQGYISVRGIAGPPVEGVFDSLGMPKEDEDPTEFDGATVKNVNTYNIGSSEDDDPNDICRVDLYAESIDGELIPDNNKKFDYYVEINCNGINVESTGGQAPITSFKAAFYFRNCK